MSKSNSLEEIIAALQNDGVVAVPTETVFGLAVKLGSKPALERLIKMKDRDVNSGKVFTLVPAKKTDFGKYADTTNAEDLIEKYVPGEITLILPKQKTFKNDYFDHFDEIGLRIPDFPIFKQILESVGPILLTSANRRDQPTLASADEIEQEFGDELDLVLNMEPGHHLPSTIVKIDENGRKVVRQGEIKL